MEPSRNVKPIQNECNGDDIELVESETIGRNDFNLVSLKIAILL